MADRPEARVFTAEDLSTAWLRVRVNPNGGSSAAMDSSPACIHEIVLKDGTVLRIGRH